MPWRDARVGSPVEFPARSAGGSPWDSLGDPLGILRRDFPGESVAGSAWEWDLPGHMVKALDGLSRGMGGMGLNLSF